MWGILLKGYHHLSSFIYTEEISQKCLYRASEDDIMQTEHCIQECARMAICIAIDSVQTII